MTPKIKFKNIIKEESVFQAMTLRDYFAAHAPECPDSFLWGAQALKGRRAEDAFNRLIEWPYYWADEQMKQRERK